MRTSNPVLNEELIRGYAPSYAGRSMTIEGAINKTGLLLVILTIAAAYTWSQVFQGASPQGPMMLGLFGGFILALVTSFKPDWSPISAPVYAAFEGLFLGGFSAILDQRFHGIPMQAVAATFGVLLIMLALYRSRVIQPTQRFTMGVIAATGGVALLYFVSIILGLFHVSVPFIFGSGPVGILFSVVVAGLAALNLILDFGFIEQGAASGAPAFMEWYGAFGLMVTLIWLYLEIVRLLTKLQGNSRDW